MYSLVARVVVFGFTKHAGTVGFWGQIVLPMAATLLYLFIILADGEECFYKTTIPVGMMALYGGICILHVIQSRLHLRCPQADGVVSALHPAEYPGHRAV